MCLDFHILRECKKLYEYLMKWLQNKIDIKVIQLCNILFPPCKIGFLLKSTFLLLHLWKREKWISCPYGTNQHFPVFYKGKSIYQHLCLHSEFNFWTCVLNKKVNPPPPHSFHFTALKSRAEQETQSSGQEQQKH